MTLNILSIGSDKNLLVPGSAVRERMALYGQACDELHIIIPGLGGTEKISDNVFVHPTGTVNPLKRMSAAVAAGKKIGNVDLITAQDPFEYGFAALKLGRKLGVPVELQVHTDISSPYFKKDLKNKTRMVNIKRRLARAASVRVVSERVAHAVEKLAVPRGRISVLPVFVDAKKFIAVSHIPSEKEKIILMAGRLEKEKEYPSALKAFARVHAHISEARLHIAGDGALKVPLVAQARMLGVAGAVVFLGAVKEVTTHLAQAHVFLHTSQYEGFGAVLAEAALAGVPIVSTDVGIAGTLLKDGEHARVVPVGDIDTLTGALLETITRPHKAHERALAASAWMHKNLLSPDEYVAKLKSIWQKTAEKK